MSTNADIVKILKAMAKDLNQMKISINELVEATDGSKQSIDVLLDANDKSKDMYKVLNAKLDLFKNLDMDSRENIQDKKSSKKISRPSFFKQLFLEQRDMYMDKLYTQDEIDAIYSLDEVKKKKDADKATKAAALIFLNHIKANVPEGRFSEFESIYAKAYP